MSLLLIHGTVKRSLEMKTVMRFTKGKEKIIKNKAINSTDEGKGRHRKVIRIGAFALVFVVLFSFVSTFFKMTDAVNIATIEGFYKEPKNTIDVMMIGASEVYADYSEELWIHIILAWGIWSARQSVQIYAQRSSHQTASEGCGF